MDNSLLAVRDINHKYIVVDEVLSGGNKDTGRIHTGSDQA